tara:strand:- start:875 stop:1138 length:264 start_codon:yes stop_codon:yes gene_type:complete
MVDFMDDIGKKVLEPLPIPAHMFLQIPNLDGEEKETRKDDYGTDLTFIYAGDFQKIIFPEDSLERDVATKAFIDCLPDKTPIVLFWY